MRSRRWNTLLNPAAGAVAALIVTTGLLSAGLARGAEGGIGVNDNPCLGPEAGQLLCPDLRVGPAEDLYVVRHGTPRPAGGDAYAARARLRRRL